MRFDNDHSHIVSFDTDVRRRSQVVAVWRICIPTRPYFMVFFERI